MLPVLTASTVLLHAPGWVHPTIVPPADPSDPTRLASEAISAAATHGTVALLGGRVVVTCDLTSPAPERYAVAVDGHTLVGPCRARHAHAVVAGHASAGLPRS